MAITLEEIKSKIDFPNIYSFEFYKPLAMKNFILRQTINGSKVYDDLEAKIYVNLPAVERVGKN